MRFNEFRVVLEDNQEKFYTIGDSHTAAVGNNQGWINLAVVGASSTGTHPTIQKMLGNISQVEPGSTVLISLGANDTANAFNTASEQKTKLKDPQTIANNVISVVDKVKAQKPSKIVFLLFPNGPGRTGKSKDAQYNGSDYQDAVRAAIKSKLDIPIIDLNGRPLKTDGIHAVDSVYSDVSKQILRDYKPNAGPANDKSNSEKNDKDTVTTTFKIPTSSNGVSYGKKGGGISAELMDVQKALIAMGYDLGPKGADGIYGKHTRAAVKKFQAQIGGLVVDGDPGPETVNALNAKIATMPNKFKTVAQSTVQDLKTVNQSNKVVPVNANVPELPKPAQEATVKGQIGAVLNLVSSPESGGHYDIMFGGNRYPKITDMTISELLKFQDDYWKGKITGKKMRTAAAGRYQFMPDTLKDVVAGMGIDPDKVKFTPENQDKLITYRLKSIRRLDDWLKNEIPDNEFMDQLAQEFAGLPSPSKGGKSWYPAQQANISLSSVANALADIKTMTT